MGRQKDDFKRIVKLICDLDYLLKKHKQVETKIKKTRKELEKKLR